MRSLTLSLTLGMFLFSNPQAARLDPAIDRVEEDWELVIKTTDVEAAGPQITTTMCPGPIEDHPDVNFNLNYRQGESFQPGGLQIQIYDGKDILTSAESGTTPLQSDNETITWTQRLSVAAGSATYRIQSGQSTTWGTFGGDDLSVTFDTSLSDLTAYNTDVSTSKSGIGWQSDHITSMRLLRVRYYSSENLIRTDATAKTIYPTP